MPVWKVQVPHTRSTLSPFHISLETGASASFTNTVNNTLILQLTEAEGQAFEIC